MNVIANHKIIFYVTVGLLLIGFYDVLLHSVYVMLHTCFEWIELGLEHLIEHIFQTDRKQSQVIVFYILLSAVAFICYRLCLSLPSCLAWLKKALTVQWLIYKNHLLIYLAQQPLVKKIKIFTACFIGMGVVVFFAMN